MMKHSLNTTYEHYPKKIIRKITDSLNADIDALQQLRKDTGYKQFTVKLVTEIISSQFMMFKVHTDKLRAEKSPLEARPVLFRSLGTLYPNEKRRALIEKRRKAKEEKEKQEGVKENTKESLQNIKPLQNDKDNN